MGLEEREDGCNEFRFSYHDFKLMVLFCYLEYASEIWNAFDPYPPHIQDVVSDPMVDTIIPHGILLPPPGLRRALIPMRASS